MIKLICGLLSLILLICAIEGEIHMDCENPPAVEFASVEVVDNEDNVGAIYTCDNGYELQGPLELLCDLDTDEWNTDPPICVPLNEVDNDGHEDDDDAANEIEPEPKRKRKQQHIVEDTQVPVEMASSLDMSCGQENITAPQVSNGYVKKYERRRRAQHVFLVAIYACNQNYEIEEHEVLYCSERRWIGNLPVCTSLNDDEEYEEYEEEEEKVTANEEERVSQSELIDAKPDEADEDADEYKDEEESEHEEQVTEKAIATEDVKSTQDPYEPRLLDRDCGDTNGGCSQTCERVVFPGENEPRLKCSCYEGFSLDPYDYSSCHDIDECQINNGGCGQICNNTPGSFHCSCEQGLQIDGPNGKTCIDINECESPEVEQECGGACENTQGSYRCLPVLNTRVDPIVETLQCAEGFELNADGTECLDVDECAAETHECSHECLNTSGGYECSCPGGYRLSLNNKYACEDIDECLAEPQLCGELTCTNFPGSYACKCTDGSEPNAETGICASEVLEPVCEAGFVLSADGQSCEDVDECQLANGGCEHICSNNKGGYECSCHAGFELLFTESGTSFCFDIDECATATHTCSADTLCENLSGSYTCLCPSGYAHAHPSPLHSYNDSSSLSSICLDIDECSINNGNCSHFCINSPGSYECACPPDYALDAAFDNRTCELVNLCLLESHADCEHICRFEAGAVHCDCQPGFVLGADAASCHDIDECLMANASCAHNCTNEPGGYACSCADGYQLAPNARDCWDIDECSPTTKIAECSHLCLNLLGSYTCDCPEGYQLQPDQRTCLDIDECSTNRHNCTHECLNTDGSYACACPTGYYLHDDKLSCLDVDECQSGAHACSHECLNAVGSYGCICPAGFELTADERTCQLKEVDRCALQNGGCSHFCDNELGCSCPPGHKLASDNSSCIDVDECAISNGGCSHECLNREGGYDCRCPKGYELSAENPWSCVDINECLTPHICQHECHNSNGSYSCSCPFGYELRNERYCADIDECAVANGGCVGGECINHNGGHECRCAVGQRLAWDRRTCEARTDLRDACPPFKAPANGFIHCTKYRHKQQLFYKTKCEVGCNAGYRLEGASRRFCNSSGLWDQQKSVCTRVFCGGLPAPRYGRLMPFFCNSPMVVANTVCRLECWPGTYRPVGAAQSVCTEQGVWSHNRTMDCHNSYHHTRHRVNQVFQPRTISSSDGGFSIWGQSQAVPNTPPRSKLGKIESPIIVFCTPSFTVNLRPNQVTRSITWKEPRFKSATLMKVNRSKIPGSLFGIGEHRIMYEATNADNIKSRCEFNIIVRAAASTPAPILPAMNLDFTDNGIMTRRGPLVSNSALIEPKLVTAQLLAGHEAYVICPGKMPYKVKSAQVNFPVNCQLKSVRTNSHTTQHRLLQRRLFTSQQWMPFTNY